MNRVRGIGRKSARASFFLAASQTVQKLFGLLRLAILGRLLTKEDFGLIAMAMIAVELAETLTRTGFNRALIQRAGNVDDYLSTAWWIAVIRGFLLAAVVWASAGWVGDFFHSEEVVPLLRTVSCLFALDGLRSIGLMLFERELSYGRLVVWRQGPFLTELTVTIGLAFWLRNAWAIVIGMVAGRVFGMVSSYAIHPFRPKFQFDMQKAAALFHFGKWVLGGSFLVFLSQQLDMIFTGRWLGVVSIGVYLMAKRLGTQLPNAILFSVTRVTFSAASRLNHDPQRRRDATVKCLSLLLVWFCPITAFVFVLASPILHCFVGAKWLEASLPLSIFALSIPIDAVGHLLGTTINASGHPQITFRLSALRMLLLLPLLYVGIHRWGTAGAAGAAVASALLTLPYTWYASQRTLLLTCNDAIRLLVPTGVATLITTIALLGIRQSFSPDEPWLLLATALPVGTVVYAVSLWAIDSLSGGLHRATLATALSYASFGREAK